MAWWLASRFKEVTSLVFAKTEQLQIFFTTKIDAHEKVDNKRFEDLGDDIWMMRVRLAAADINGQGGHRDSGKVEFRQRVKEESTK
jgi:hypothetical protein